MRGRTVSVGISDWSQINRVGSGEDRLRPGTNPPRCIPDSPVQGNPEAVAHAALLPRSRRTPASTPERIVAAQENSVCRATSHALVVLHHESLGPLSYFLL
jgi:hypothetical protein